MVRIHKASFRLVFGVLFSNELSTLTHLRRAWLAVNMVTDPWNWSAWLTAVFGPCMKCDPCLTFRTQVPPSVLRTTIYQIQPENFGKYDNRCLGHFLGLWFDDTNERLGHNVIHEPISSRSHMLQNISAVCIVGSMWSNACHVIRSTLMPA